MPAVIGCENASVRMSCQACSGRQRGRTWETRRIRERMPRGLLVGLSCVLLPGMACSDGTRPSGSTRAELIVRRALSDLSIDLASLNLRNTSRLGFPFSLTLLVVLCAADTTGSPQRNAAGVPHDMTLTYDSTIPTVLLPDDETAGGLRNSWRSQLQRGVKDLGVQSPT
jgi:hypothetical protein